MSNEFEDTVGGEGNSVTAAHEAGHALVAHLSPAYERILGSFWERSSREARGAVKVRSTLRKPTTAYTFWEIAAVSAAGIAGELITHMRFRTGPARSDLDALRLGAQALCGMRGGLSPVSPWPAPGDANAPPFARYFEGGLEAAPAEVIRLAYLRARERIMSHRGAYERLRTTMIVKIELSGEEIAAALAIPKG